MLGLETPLIWLASGCAQLFMTSKAIVHSCGRCLAVKARCYNPKTPVASNANFTSWQAREQSVNMSSIREAVNKYWII